MDKTSTAKKKIGKKGPGRVRRNLPRTDVGTRNPYALVEQKMGVRIDWVQTSLKGRKKIVEEYLGIPFHKLFIQGSESMISKAAVLSQKTRRVMR